MADMSSFPVEASHCTGFLAEHIKRQEGPWVLGAEQSC